MYKPFNMLGKCYYSKCKRDCLFTIQRKKCYEFLYCSIDCVTSNHNCQEQLTDCEKLKSMSRIQKSIIGLGSGREFDDLIAIENNDRCDRNYTALSKKDNKWYKFDGLHVNELNEGDVMYNKNANVLFYQRQNINDDNQDNNERILIVD